MTEKRIKLCW